MSCAFLSGCSTDKSPVPVPIGTTPPNQNGATPLSADVLRPGDRIRIVFNDIPDAPTPTEQIIPEDGKMLLPKGIEVEVGGKKRTDVEREIADIYLEKRIYRKISVTIERMSSFVSVGGEVRSPNSILYRGDLNVLSAIDAAGGFTEYAKRGDVIVTRAATRQQFHVNASKAVRDPALNLPLYPGDSVYVPRKIF
jgi:protein involved in polysaccharide export with SLBB domain